MSQVYNNGANAANPEGGSLSFQNQSVTLNPKYEIENYSHPLENLGADGNGCDITIGESVVAIPDKMFSSGIRYTISSNFPSATSSTTATVNIPAKSKVYQASYNYNNEINSYTFAIPASNRNLSGNVTYGAKAT